MVRLAADVMECESREGPTTGTLVPRERAIALVLAAAHEYYNSASALNDPAIHLAK